MGDEYTPGDGARTLRWVAGMLSTDGWCCVRVDRDGVPTFATAVLGRYGYAELADIDGPPDLTDRATFLLALDQLAQRRAPFRIDWPAWASWHTKPEALDRALWETREVSDAE